MNPKTDIICVGEVLIDYIGNEVNTLENTKNFTPYLGGSPTNVAVNAAKLGLNSVLIASCGKDEFADFIFDKLNQSKVITTQIAQIDKPTSIIYISRSLETPEFKAIRTSDFEILENQIPDELLENSKIFHTTCFALSKNPARATILNRAKKAVELGLQLSIDINYSDKIWSDRNEMQQVIKQYLSYNPIVKVSDDDCLRIFDETKSDDEIFEYFHNLGANTICLTKGENGVKLSDKTDGIIFMPANKIENIKDTTGAGDAFWTGFLYAKLHGKNNKSSLEIAHKLAVIKLQNIGGLPEDIEISKLFLTS